MTDEEKSYQASGSQTHEPPTWIISDNSSGERGALLYLEEWGRERRFVESGVIFRSRSLIALGSLTMLIGIALLVSGEMTGAFVLLCGMIVLIIGALILKKSFEAMPFSIYENGFTLAIVPWDQGRKRLETFIPWERLNEVELMEPDLMIQRRVRFRYDDDREMLLSHLSNPGFPMLTEPFELMKLLIRYVPDRMTGFDAYVGDKQDHNSTPTPYIAQTFDHLWPIRLAVMIPLMVMLGSLINERTAEWNDHFSLLLATGIIVPSSTALFHILAELDRFAQRNIIRKLAAVTPEGVSFPLTFYGKHCKVIRNPIPWCEVRTVTKKLDPAQYIEEAELELANGETFRIPHEIYLKMDELTEFIGNDWDYFRSTPATAAPPVEQWKRPWQIAFIALLSAPGLLVVVSGAQWEPIWNMACFFIVFFAILPAFLFLRITTARRTRLNGTDFSVTDEEIRVPNGPPDMQRISSADYVGARIDKDLFGRFCELETSHGSIRLPHSAALELVSAGYHVNNTGNLLHNAF